MYKFKISLNFPLSNNWPNNPKFIFTSNSHITDDAFKIWCAEHNKSNNIKIIVGQHGSGYGIHYNPVVYNPIDLKIADYFIIWGNSFYKSDQHKIISAFIFYTNPILTISLLFSFLLFYLFLGFYNNSKKLKIKI